MISSFHGAYRFLSNFYPVTVVLSGRTYPTVEHAFQAAKTFDGNARDHIMMAPSAGYAKHLGRLVALRPDWDRVKQRVMLELLRSKFTNPVLRAQLIETGTHELVEGNTWGDRYWGVCGGTGENHLGKLLMQVREEIQP